MQIDQVAGGWCPHAPVMHAAQAVMPVAPAATRQAAGPGSGSGGVSGRIRGGIFLAADSLTAVFKERSLLGFMALFGAAILVLLAGEAYLLAHTADSLEFLVTLQAGAQSLILDGWIFLLQLVCLSALILIFAALIRYRSRRNSSASLTIRESFAATGPHVLTLEFLAVLMSLAGTFLFAVFTQTQFFGKIIFGIGMTLFYLPYAYYFPNLFDMAIWFSAHLIVIAAIEFLVVICAVPFIVREDAGLVTALAASFRFMKRMWLEILGGLLLCGAVLLVIAVVALVIGQSPLLLGHDYDFFLQVSRGKILMMAACYGFVLACGVLAAAGFAALGIAAADLTTLATTGQVRAEPKTGTDTAAEVSQ
jgi:hypothetical protein